MRAIFTSVFLLVALSVTQLGFCADDDKSTLNAIDKKLEACLEEAGGVTSTMRACMGTAHISLDALLNTSYKKLRASIKTDSAYAEALKQEQLAWLKLRKEAMRYAVESSGGGTIGPLLADNLSLEMMRNRIALFTMLTAE